jgi:hypothetical protein
MTGSSAAGSRPWRPAATCGVCPPPAPAATPAACLLPQPLRGCPSPATVRHCAPTGHVPACLPATLAWCAVEVRNSGYVSSDYTITVNKCTAGVRPMQASQHAMP